MLTEKSSSPVLLQALQVDKLSIAPVLLHQLAVRALLDDAALVKDVDDICLLDGAETVGDGDGRPACCGLVEGGLHDLLALAVESAGGLVEKTGVC